MAYRSGQATPALCPRMTTSPPGPAHSGGRSLTWNNGNPLLGAGGHPSGPANSLATPPPGRYPMTEPRTAGVDVAAGLCETVHKGSQGSGHESRAGSAEAEEQSWRCMWNRTVDWDEGDWRQLRRLSRSRTRPLLPHRHHRSGRRPDRGGQAGVPRLRSPGAVPRLRPGHQPGVRACGAATSEEERRGTAQVVAGGPPARLLTARTDQPG